MNEETRLDQYDEWIKDDSSYAAIVMRQWLEPVEGKDAVIFPPTYATPQGREKEEEWLGYNIDKFEDGSSVCQIDSVGSQANRMEPIFKREPYSKLVPQVIIKAKDKEINLLDAGHRAADAIVRFSSLAVDLEHAYSAFRDKGNAEPLARIAPTSIVFGSWDSRSTQAKLPRVVRSVIRAYDVKVLHRSAQYTTIAGEILEGDEVEVRTKGPKAKLGLAHVPATWAHGGILVRGDIRRDAILNLTAIRALGASSNETAGILKLRRYILGLSLVYFTAPQETFLREGCQLVPGSERKSEWNLVKHDGSRENFTLDHKDALEFGKAATSDFGVEESKGPYCFDSKKAQAELKSSKSKKERPE